jgi:hypothetical protein
VASFVFKQYQDEITRRWEEAMSEDEPDFPGFPDMEGQEALMGIGKMGLTIHRAVIRDGGNHFEAFNVTAAFFAGMMKGSQLPPDDDED